MTYESFRDNEFARQRITGFEIRAGEVIDGIRVKYGNNWGEWHGGNGGEMYQVDLGRSKVAKIKIVKGLYYGSAAVGQITIFTRDNKTLGPYGRVDTLSFESETTWDVPFGKGYITGATTAFVEDLEILVEEDDDDDDDESTGDVDEGLQSYLGSLKCKVCNENPRTHAFMYCGHFAACETCADKIFLQPGEPTCPVCKKQVSNTLRIKF